MEKKLKIASSNVTRHLDLDLAIFGSEDRDENDMGMQQKNIIN